MKIRILVVDEAAFVRDSLKRVLRQFLKNVEVFDAINGKRAMPLMHGNKMTLIVSSWDLPEMSGSELLQWVRGEENFAKIPFIAMTDGGDRKSIEEAAKSGANDILMKPFTPDEVQKKIVKQLTRIGIIKKPPAEAQSSALGSLGALTGGAAKSGVQKKREVKSAAGFGQPVAKPKAGKTSTKSGNFDGTANLKFEGFSIKCKIRELSLTTLNGLIQRASKEEIPHIFDTAAADIANSSDELIGNFNVYVHSLQANDPNPNSKIMRITLRFVDNSPDQFEPLSKAIARGR